MIPSCRTIFIPTVLVGTLAFLKTSYVVADEEFSNVVKFRVEIDGLTPFDCARVTGFGINVPRGEKDEARDLTVTRAFKRNTEIRKWIEDVKKRPTRRSGSIILLGQDEKELARFAFSGAWIKSWSGPELSKDSDGNEVLTETMTISVQMLEMK